MAKHVTPIGHELARISIDGKQYLGIHVSSASRSRATKQFTDANQTAGIVVRGFQTSEWKPGGFIEHHGEIYLYGPYLEGRTVDEVLSHSPENGLEYLHLVAGAFLLMKERSLPLPRFQTNAILFLEDGGILFFPPAVMERMRSTQVESERIQTYELYNNPDISDEENISFALGVMMYRLITGVHPFDGTSEEIIHRKMRELDILEPKLRTPELRQDISTAILDSLRKGKDRAPTIAEWETRLGQWRRQGLREPLDDRRRAELAEIAARLEKKHLSTYRRRVFFQRNLRLLVAIAIGAVVVGSIAGSIISNALKPKVTLGLEPREVVELFYASITELDHLSVEDCVTDGAAKGEVTEATNLYVITRMRMGQEGTTGFIPPDRWRRADMPALELGLAVYGIDGLEITEEGETEFRARYIKWEQPTDENVRLMDRRANAVSREREDILSLRWDDKYWAIFSLNRLRDELRDPSSSSYR